MVMRMKSTPALVDEAPVHSTQLICTPKFVALMSAGVHVAPQRVELPPYVSMPPALSHPLATPVCPRLLPVATPPLIMVTSTSVGLPGPLMACFLISTVMPLMVDPAGIANPKFVPCSSLEEALAKRSACAFTPSFAVMLPGLVQQMMVDPLQLPAVPPVPARFGPAVAAKASATIARRKMVTANLRLLTSTS